MPFCLLLLAIWKTSSACIRKFELATKASNLLEQGRLHNKDNMFEQRLVFAFSDSAWEDPGESSLQWKQILFSTLQRRYVMRKKIENSNIVEGTESHTLRTWICARTLFFLTINPRRYI